MFQVDFAMPHEKPPSAPLHTLRPLRPRRAPPWSSVVAAEPSPWAALFSIFVAWSGVTGLRDCEPGKKAEFRARLPGFTGRRAPVSCRRLIETLRSTHPEPELLSVMRVVSSEILLRGPAAFETFVSPAYRPASRSILGPDMRPFVLFIAESCGGPVDVEPQSVEDFEEHILSIPDEDLRFSFWVYFRSLADFPASSHFSSSPPRDSVSGSSDRHLAHVFGPAFREHIPMLLAASERRGLAGVAAPPSCHAARPGTRARV